MAKFLIVEENLMVNLENALSVEFERSDGGQIAFLNFAGAVNVAGDRRVRVDLPGSVEYLESLVYHGSSALKSAKDQAGN